MTRSNLVIDQCIMRIFYHFWRTDLAVNWYCKDILTVNLDSWFHWYCSYNLQWQSVYFCWDRFLWKVIFKSTANATEPKFMFKRLKVLHFFLQMDKTIFFSIILTYIFEILLTNTVLFSTVYFGFKPVSYGKLWDQTQSGSQIAGVSQYSVAWTQIPWETCIQIDSLLSSTLTSGSILSQCDANNITFYFR